MAFSVDYSKASEGIGLIPEGTYETVIRDAHLDLTKRTQDVYISVPLVIRNDIAQPYQNNILWYSIWQKKKDPDAADKACEGYSAKMVNTLSRAACLTDNKSYKSIEDWMADLKGRLIRISVRHKTENGKTFYDFGFPEKTSYPTCSHMFRQKTQPNVPAGFTQVNEDELPF